ncbi:hypothetical protein [Streptomyces flaveus]|uniref:hypothetical protein n=1 Tax=Streptomyces flaveus TaxID=66370 RepID=UPI0033166022
MVAAEGIYQAEAKELFAGESDLQELDFELGKGLQGRQDMVLAAKLPSGPGVMSVSMRSLTLPAGDTSASRPVIPMASLQLIIPAHTTTTSASPSPHLRCRWDSKARPGVSGELTGDVVGRDGAAQAEGSSVGHWL